MGESDAFCTDSPTSCPKTCPGRSSIPQQPGIPFPLHHAAGGGSFSKAALMAEKPIHLQLCVMHKSHASAAPRF